MTNNWLLRGLVFAAGMIVIRLIQGVLINTFEMHATLISVLLLLVFVAGVAVWAYADGREDAKATADPERRADLAMTWLLAGLVAGVLGGAVVWLFSLFDEGIYAGSLINELTTFASFTALLTWVPAVAAVAVGRWQVDREYEKNPELRRRRPDDDDDRADTDVFAAVGGEQAEAEATEAADPAASAETTELAPAGEEQTTAIATLPDFEKTEPKKRWWQRSKKTAAAPTVPAPTAYTMDQTQPVETDQAGQAEETVRIDADGSAEPTTEIPAVSPAEDEQTTEIDRGEQP